MAICRSCQSYYKKNQWNQSDECNDCAYTADVPLFDEEDSLEVEHLLNPSGRTLPRFNE
jgi:NMD protein affecting ribosome stability and mRNA decay